MLSFDLKVGVETSLDESSLLQKLQIFWLTDKNIRKYWCIRPMQIYAFWACLRREASKKAEIFTINYSHSSLFLSQASSRDSKLNFPSS